MALGTKVLNKDTRAGLTSPHPRPLDTVFTENGDTLFILSFSHCDFFKISHSIIIYLDDQECGGGPSTVVAMFFILIPAQEQAIPSTAIRFSP